jgi:hypothetical protein
MKKTKVISDKNLPVRAPILLTAVVYLFLDKFNAVGWVWGVVGTIFALLWIGYFYGIATSDGIDIFKEEK